MKAKREPMSPNEAVDKYFGGISGLNAMALPYKCSCGSSTYTKKEKDEFGDDTIELPIMDISGVFKHIRRVHGELKK